MAHLLGSFSLNKSRSYFKIPLENRDLICSTTPLGRLSFLLWKYVTFISIHCLFSGYCIMLSKSHHLPYYVLLQLLLFFN